MTGKAPPSRSRKDKPRSSRPYDRPNQSILGKVASTVKGLFTPSWLFSVSSWVRTNVVEEEEINANPEDTVEADLTENEDEPEVQPIVRPRLSGRLKRPRLECSENATSTSEDPFWMGPSTSRDNLSQKMENPPVSSIITDCESVRKETPIIVNGDDHSENSDGSASTSGCSSLVSSQDKTHRSSGLKLSDCALELLRGELKSKPAFQRQKKEASTLTTDMLSSSRSINQGNVSLWSCRTQTPVKSPQIPSLLNTSRPSFNVSSFGGPSKGNSSDSKISSPFYEGSTTFGGASAYRRRPMTNTPYQLNRTKSLQCQVKVKENTSGKEFECMSSAAKRILHTLETMSTPVTDAKKIPTVCKSPLDIPLAITPPSQRLRSYLSVSRPSSAPSPKGPPIVNLNAISKLTVLRNNHSRAKSTMMELPLKEQPMVSLPDDCSVTATQYSSDNTTNARSSGGGKIKTKLREPLHASIKGNVIEETGPEYDLPNVPLPISSSMPVFKFNTKTVTEKANDTPKNQKEDEKKSELSSVVQETQFTFANPIEYIPPKNSFQLQKTSMENSFKFSSPLVVAPKSQSEEKDIYSNRSVDDILRSLRENSSSQPTKEKPDKEGQTENAAKTMEDSKATSSTIATSGFGDKFRPKAGSWSCTSCLVQNDESQQKCVACETPKAAPVNNTSRNIPLSSFAASPLKVLTEPGSWECRTCLVKNEAKISKCAACEAPKLETTNMTNNRGFGDKFKPKADTWECPSCMVRNEKKVKLCVACETPNPIQSSPTTNLTNDVGEGKSDTPKESPANSSSSKLFQNTAGTWECDTCMVRNSLEKSKCIACETLRPSKEKTAGSFNSSSFKFGVSASDTPQVTTFKFGTFVSTSVPTTSTFKFGVPVDSTKSSSTPANFNFGNPTKMISAPVVTFGNSALPAKQSSDSSQDNEAKTEKKPSPVSFKFGASTASVASSKANNAVASKSSDVLVTSASATVSDSGGFQFTKPLITNVSSPDSGISQLGKPLVITSNEPGGFKFQTTAFGSSFGSSIKPAGLEVVPKTSECFNPPISSTTTPTFSIGNMVSSQSDASHSKTVTQKTETSILPRVEINPVQSVVSTFSNTAPVFSFGTVTSIPATNVTLSSTTSSGLFGSNSAQSQQKGLNKGDELSKRSVVSNTPQTACETICTVSSAANAQFSFNPTNVFPSIPTTTATTTEFVEAKAMSSSTQDQIPRTQTTPSFSFGSASSVFAFGSGTTQTTSSSNFTNTVAAKPMGVVNTAEMLQNSQKNLFNFGASSKLDGKNAQTGFAFKSEKEDNFTPQSQTNFGAFQSDPASNSAMSSVPSPSLFKFGSTTPSSTGGFVFGATTKADSAPTRVAQFTFGSGAPKPSTFGGFQQNQQTAVTSSVPTFSFGGSMPTSSSTPAFDPAGTRAFTFAQKNSQLPPNMLLKPVSHLPEPAAPAPTFGSQATQPVFGGSAPTFGSIAASPAILNAAATPAFGSVAAPKPEQSGGFNFNPQQHTSLFTFGASAEKKSAPSQGTGFNFNVAPQVEASANFSPSFSINAPPSFNFGATSTPTNQPFQFAASSDVSSTSTSTASRKIRKAVRRGLRKAD